ncbi:penicillin-binding protein [Ferrigenium kumadai]|uniref:Peptidoglycan D,D-transpeptidase MrdA n=1 Tax=Ferrigenium kumadai TaxID=1682490 RepID=A0AAN1VYU2_9PROT|nr:penicillin-binding protein 2 [Ferrigenium kumadai]BBI98450.1 penicillin-binding protein [Ferrigenium kumadai]
MSKHVELKNHQREIFYFRLRLAISIGFVLTLFGILLVRFIYLQVVRHDYYQTLAESNRISVVPIVPNRGLILDRNGVVMAHNYSGYTLEVTPNKTKGLEATIDELSTLVEITPRDRKRFKKLLAERRNFETLMIRNKLTDEEVARFAAQQYRFPGVEIKARLFRDYPYGDKTAHLIGYIGRINQTDVEQLEENEQAANYRGSDYIGKTGLEQSYEDELHGTTGVEQVEVDSGGRAVRMLSRSSPVSGNTLVLSVDAKLQEIAFQAFGNYRGALIAIDPSNGEVLAFVSKPGYDPSLFIDGIDLQTWDELNNSPDKPMVNRAVNGAYPPGSTFKPYMALGALTLGKRRPEQTIFDPGYFTFGNHTFRDDKKGGHGSVDMYKSIVESCDTYYYTLANDMGIDNISNFMRQFGFGQRTGIDIEGESEGVLPSQEWKRKRFKKPELQKWYAGETISIGIGQGYNAYTPIQLAQAVATLANNGVMYRPHLVRHITDTRTGEKTLIEPKSLRTIPLRQEDIDVIKRAMIGVNKEGTGAAAFAGAGYVSAGKTGTAQVYSLKGEKYSEGHVKQELRDHALFIAFAPADQPKIALAVLVENGGFGAATAAPIARKVLDYYLLGKVPQPLPDDAAKEGDGND